MARNTHDRQHDHRGEDLTSNILLDGATASYADQDVLQDVISDLDDRAGTGGGGGMVELITSTNDTSFTSNLGSWTNTGGTASRDTSYKMAGATASLKFVCTTSNQRLDLPITGTFEADKDYWVVVFLSHEGGGSGTTPALGIDFGLIGTDAKSVDYIFTTNYTAIVGSSNWGAYAVRWRPTADRTGVSLRINSNNTSSFTFHVGHARAWQSPMLPTLVAYGASYVPFNGELSTGQLRLSPFPSPGFGQGGFRIGQGGEADMTNFSAVSGLSVDTPYSYMWFEHTPADKPQEGLNIEVGDDYIGFFIGQKDSDTVQFYADYDDFNFEFEDGAANGWKFVAGDAGVAWPAKGMLPQYSSAPGSPVEGQSYYDTTLNKSRTWDGSAWQNWW